MFEHLNGFTSPGMGMDVRPRSVHPVAPAVGREVQLFAVRLVWYNCVTLFDVDPESIVYIFSLPFWPQGPKDPIYF